MNHKAERQARLLELVARGPWYAGVLSRALKTSKTTVARDVKQLRDAGHHIRSSEAGYYLCKQ